jgi:hypothetical protein
MRFVFSLWQSLDSVWEGFVRDVQTTDDNTAHFMLYNSGHKHTLTICNTYCCYTATIVARKRLNATLCVFCLSCFIEWVVSSGNTSHMFWRFLIRISAEVSDMPIVIETLLLFLWSSVHHQLTVNYHNISFRASYSRLSRISVGSTSVNNLDNFRRTDVEFSLCLFCDISLDNISTFCPTTHCEFSRLIRLTYGEFSRNFFRPSHF